MQQYQTKSRLKGLKAGLSSHIKALHSLDRQAGASLIEILVAVSIIVILMSAIGIAVIGNIDKAKRTVANQDINTLKLAAKNYQVDKFELPTALEDLLRYLDVEPDGPDPFIDPWGTRYEFEILEADGAKRVRIRSAGPNKSMGDDDDIPPPANATD